MKIFLLALLAVSASAFKVRPVGRSGIIGGEQAAKGQFPYIIDVRVGGHYCGGSILDENWVITAAHCATQLTTAYSLVAGEHNLAIDDGDEQRRNVELIIQHEDYNQFTIRNDIALMKVTEPFVFNDMVQPITLNTELNVADRDCVVTGWGSIVGDRNNLDYPDELYTVVMPIVDDASCMDVMNAFETNMCAGDIDGGKSACYADSGGPLVVNYGNGDILTGLVSYGPSTCGSADNYSVFCEVAHYVTWVEETIANNS